MIAVIGCIIKDPVIRSVNIFMPDPLMYIIKRVINMLEKPDVAADHAF